MSNTIKGSLGDIISSIPAQFVPELLKVQPEKQGDLKDAWKIYACWFMTFYQYFKTTENLSMQPEDFKRACVSLGGLTNAFAVLDETDKVSMIAKAAGINAIRRDATSGIKDKLVELISSGKPVPFSLNGEHYELCIGYNAGASLFTISDPGYQNDTCMDASTLEVFHMDDHGNRIYSKCHDGNHRRCTRIFWFEEAHAVV